MEKGKRKTQETKKSKEGTVRQRHKDYKQRKSGLLTNNILFMGHKTQQTRDSHKWFDAE